MKNTNQQWSVVRYKDGTVSLVNAASGKCLDAEDYGKGTKVIQYGCHGKSNQRWHYVVEGTRTRFMNVASGKCLDASDYGRGLNVIQYDCGTQSNQLWY